MYNCIIVLYIHLNNPILFIRRRQRERNRFGRPF